MGNKYQDRWMDFLPLVLLGRSTALQPDIGASPSEMVFGENVKIPGQLLSDLSDNDSLTSLQELLIETKKKTIRPVSQPSRHCPPEAPLPDIPDGITHVYTRQHQKTGLDTPFQGPFRLVERLSKSTVKLEVGIYKSGEKRYEVRHLNDLRLAHPESLAAPIQRPKLGRRSASDDGQSSTDGSGSETTPSNEFCAQNFKKQTNDRSTNATPVDSDHATSISSDRVPASVPDSGLSIETSGPPPNPAFPSRSARSSRNPNPKYVDAIWSASPEEIRQLNRSIGQC